MPRKRRRKGDRKVALFFSAVVCLLPLLALSSALVLSGCRSTSADAREGGQGGASPEPWRGSVVVFSFDVMRPDRIGALGGREGLTPEIDRFAASADYVGRAVAASSTPLVALAASFTGTGALQHRLLSHLEADLRPSVPTLAELFWHRGYDTVFFEPRPTWIWRYGLMRGMTRNEGFSEAQVLHELPLFDATPRFYWIELPEADAPYTDRSAELPGLHLPLPARRQIGVDELMPYADPARPVPALLQKESAELFDFEVAAGDARFGRLLAALERSAASDDTLVVLTASTGTELGESGQFFYGQNLSRQTIEVPLLIRLPPSLKARGFAIAEKAGPPVAAERLFATLAESIGALPPPISAPSLYRHARRPALSALPLHNGVNFYSAVFPSPRPGILAEQVIRKSRFAPTEEDFYKAQSAEAGVAVVLPETPRQLFERLRDRFEQAPPWQSAEVLVEGFTWIDATSSVQLEDPARLEELGALLDIALFHHLDAERTAEQEKALIGSLEQPQPEGKSDESRR